MTENTSAAPAHSAPRRIRQEHVTGSAVGSAVVAIALSLFQSNGIGAKVEGHAHELSEQLREQSKTITTLQLTLVEIKSQGAARDAAFAQLGAGLADVVKELRELERARATDSEQLREHDRRLGSIEGRK